MTTVRLEGDDSKAQDAIKSVIASLRQLQGVADEAADSLGGISKPVEKSKTGLAAWGREIGIVKKAAAGLGYSGVAGDVDDLAVAFEGAGVGSAAMAVGVGAAVVALLAIIPAAASGAQTAIEYARNVDGLADSFKGLQGIDGFQPPDQATIDASRDLNAEIAALQAVASQVATIWLSDLAPAFAAVGHEIVVVSVAARDVQQIYSDMNDVIASGGGYLETYAQGWSALQTQASGWTSVADQVIARERELANLEQAAAFRKQTLTGLERSMADVNHDVASASRDAAAGAREAEKAERDRARAVQAETDALQALQAITDRNNASGDEFAELRAARDREYQQILNIAGATDDLQAVTAALNSVDVKYARERDERLQKYADDTAAAREKSVEQTRKEQEAIREQYQQTYDELQQKEREKANFIIGLSLQTSQIIGEIASREYQRRTDLADELEADLKKNSASMTEAEKEAVQKRIEANRVAALNAFKLQQAASLTSIAFNTAGAITKAMEIFGPPPSPGGIAAIATATLIGGTQAATVLAQKPPKSHVGYAGDEQLITRTRDESTLTGRATRALGRDTINQLNRGVPTQSGQQTASLDLDGRAQDSLAGRMHARRPRKNERRGNGRFIR